MKMVITRIVLKLIHFRQWLVAQLTFGLLNFLKIFPADPAIRFADRFARYIGPKFWRHKLMMTNLRNAFPEKGEAERRELPGVFIVLEQHEIGGGPHHPHRDQHQQQATHRTLHHRFRLFGAVLHVDQV